MWLEFFRVGQMEEEAQNGYFQVTNPVWNYPLYAMFNRLTLSLECTKNASFNVALFFSF